MVFVKDVLLEQKRAGRLGLAEQPWASQALHEDPMQELLENGYVKVRGDQCRWDLRHFFSNMLTQKGTAFLVPEDSSLAVRSFGRRIAV